MGRKLHRQWGEFLVPDRRTTNKNLLEAKMSLDPDLTISNMIPTNVFEERLNYLLFDGELGCKKIMRYGGPPRNQENSKYSMAQILSRIGNPKSPQKEIRESIADEPTHTFKCNIRDDFYLNLLDFSVSNNLALGVQKEVFILSNTSFKTVGKLGINLGGDEYISSLRWSEGVVAVGTSEGNVEIWDVQAGRKVRGLGLGMGRVAAVAWGDGILSCGTHSGVVHNYDMKTSRKVCTLREHKLEVCGLKWSSGWLASGGNDDVVAVWDYRKTKRPICLFGHSAAVKALDWSPRNAHILASGGGSADRKIRVFNVKKGLEVACRETTSQVSGLCFSKHDAELFSSHGYDINGICAWGLPKMESRFTVEGHGDRVLGMAMSPDGYGLATISSDFTLKLWKCLKFVKPGVNDIYDPLDRLHSFIR